MEDEHQEGQVEVQLEQFLEAAAKAFLYSSRDQVVVPGHYKQGAHMKRYRQCDVISAMQSGPPSPGGRLYHSGAVAAALSISKQLR